MVRSALDLGLLCSNDPVCAQHDPPKSVMGSLLTTIEGNTNDTGSREDIGVFRRQKRTIASVSRSYLSYEA
ncbi:MAG: hypothetical protein WA672_09030 [Candidatus Angelobacter sp.]